MKYVFMCIMVVLVLWLFIFLSVHIARNLIDNAYNTEQKVYNMFDDVDKDCLKLLKRLEFPISDKTLLDSATYILHCDSGKRIDKLEKQQEINTKLLHSLTDKE